MSKQTFRADQADAGVINAAFPIIGMRASCPMVR